MALNLGFDPDKRTTTYSLLNMAANLGLDPVGACTRVALNLGYDPDKRTTTKAHFAPCALTQARSASTGLDEQ